MQKVRAATAALAVVLVSSPLAARTDAAAAAPTCHGERATLVGKPGKVLRGTGRRDVVVTAGSSDVATGAGDDLICVVGGGDFTLVRSEGGDDAVYVVGKHRGQVQFVSGSGSDTFVGRAERDLVTLDLDGRDHVRTGESRDDVVLRPTTGRPRTTIDLGGGRDEIIVWTRSSRTKQFPDGLTADLRKDRVTLTTSATGASYRLEVTGLERVFVNQFATVRLTGDDHDNDLRATGACSATLVGHGGDDLLRVDGVPACAPPATSTADGGDGQDTCRAAVVSECEEVLPFG
jgi:hypothetical protein